MERKLAKAFTTTLVAFASVKALGLEPPFADGRYLRFDGPDGMVAVDTSATPIAWPADFTIDVWVYPTRPSPFGVIAGRTADNRDTDPFHHAVLAFEGEDGLTPTLVQSTGTPGSYRAARSRSPIPIGRWTHLAGVKQGSALRIYVNGILQGEGRSAGPTPTSNIGARFAIGGGVQSGMRVCCNVSGILRNVRLWGAALPDTAVRASALSPRPPDLGPGLPLVRSWAIDDGAGGLLASTQAAGAPLRHMSSWRAPSFPRWTHAGYLLPRAIRQSTEVPIRRSVAYDLWPYRAGGETRFLLTQIHSSTIPETPRRVSALRVVNGRLVDSSATDLVGTPETVHARDHAQLDANGDGRMDLFIGDFGSDTNPFPGGINRIFIQQPDGRMADETSSRITGLGPTLTHGVGATDIDNDGDTDLMVCSLDMGRDESQMSTILVNDGRGHFRSDRSRLPSELRQRDMASCLSGRFADVDGDGDADFVFGLWWTFQVSSAIESPERDGIMLNDGRGRFTLAPRDALPPRGFGRDRSQTTAIDVGDVDQDGDTDVVASVTNSYTGYPSVRLWLNDGTGRFSDASDRLGLGPLKKDTFVLWARLVDFDADGWLDLFIDGYGPYDVLLNRGGRFLSIGHPTGVFNDGECSGASHPTDVNGDGILDIVIAGGPVPSPDVSRLCTVTLPTDLVAAIESPAIALASGQAFDLHMAPGSAMDRVFIDVPPGAREVRFETSSAENVDLFVARREFSASPMVAWAPPRNQATHAARTPSGNEVVTLMGGNLSSGRWYVTAVNPGTRTARVTVKATIVAADPAPSVAAGHFFNPSRSGHGISYEYVSGQRVLIWYTYLDDGTPVWYYAQAAAPSPNHGVWKAPLLRFHWSNDLSRSMAVPVGSVMVTEIGKNQSGTDRIVFTWNLDGSTGSEMMERLGGTGCPAGFEGNNGMWFAPSLPGYGYTVTYFPDYEFIPVYLYDDKGNPVWVSGERAGFTPADTQIPLFQISGFCPWCTRPLSALFQPAGVMSRRFTGGRISALDLDVNLVPPLTGRWLQARPVQLLTDSSPCVVPRQ